MSIPFSPLQANGCASACESSAEPVEYSFARRISNMNVSAVREILKVTERPEIISFAGGMPAPELFPVRELAQAYAEVFAEDGPKALQYSITEGAPPLRRWIAHRLRRRGIDASAERVLITSGSQQGIDLVARAFIEPGDTVIVESPSYLAAIQAFNGYEANIVSIDSDDEGMRIEQVEQALSRSAAKLIYAVPNFHNPKGTSLSAERRQSLVNISRKHRVPIVEDDAYGELRYTPERHAPLASMDSDGLVIHLGTFSKTLSPGMRIGWASGSDEVVRAMVLAKQAADLHTSTLQQMAAARLLSTFDYDSHVSRLCEVYGERCRIMLEALEAHFPAGAKWTRPGGGLFIWVELPEKLSGEELLEEAIGEGVAFVPGAAFFASEAKPNFLRLNFSNSAPELITEGVKRIAKVIKRRLV